MIRKLMAKPVSGRARFATFVDIAENVKSALEKRLPVVALESTIITHGMPVPENFNTALQVEDIIQEQVHTAMLTSRADEKEGEGGKITRARRQRLLSLFFCLFR